MGVLPRVGGGGGGGALVASAAPATPAAPSSMRGGAAAAAASPNGSNHSAATTTAATATVDAKKTCTSAAPPATASAAAPTATNATAAVTPRPVFHVAPASGWINDPNAPFEHRGLVHLFYQHVPASAEWRWNLVWGHAVSADLVTWSHLPVALAPTAGGPDRHGCFSGCGVVDVDGRPALLYTGVVRKQPHEVPAGFSPQHEAQLIAVADDPDDPALEKWRKLPADAFLPAPSPPELLHALAAWRDPFVIERPGAAGDGHWVVMVGAGVRGGVEAARREGLRLLGQEQQQQQQLDRGNGSADSCTSNGRSSGANGGAGCAADDGGAASRIVGTALVYRAGARDLAGGGWEYLGPLCEAPERDAHTVWECPVMALLSSRDPRVADGTGNGAAHHNNGNGATTTTTTSNGNGSGSGNGGSSPSSYHQRHMLCVSPDYCANQPVVYLGAYAAGRFDINAADGPQRLDLGDRLYAPQVLRAPGKDGRTVLWAWVQEDERRRPAAPGAAPHDSACCLCAPRVLFLSPDGRTLRQAPLPELARLRCGGGGGDEEEDGGASPPWRTPAATQLPPRVCVPLGGAAAEWAHHVDVELTLSRGGADAVALLLAPLEGSGDGGDEEEDKNGQVAAAAGGAAGAAICYCWATRTLQVVFDARADDLGAVEALAKAPLAPPPHQRLPAPPAAAAAAPATRCGGALPLAHSSPDGNGGSSSGDEDGDTIRLRVLLDGSCVEVFTGGGAALTTRVYRGHEALLACGGGGSNGSNGSNGSGSNARARARGGGLSLVTFGAGAAVLEAAACWEMRPIWAGDAGGAAAAAAAAIAAAPAQAEAAEAEAATTTSGDDDDESEAEVAAAATVGGRAARMQA